MYTIVVFFCGPNVTLSSCSWLGYYKLCALLSTLLNGFRGWVMVTVLEKGPLCACSSTLYSLVGKCLCIIIMCNNTYIILTKNVCSMFTYMFFWQCCTWYQKQSLFRCHCEVPLHVWEQILHSLALAASWKNQGGGGFMYMYSILIL